MRFNVLLHTLALTHPDFAHTLMGSNVEVRGMIHHTSTKGEPVPPSACHWQRDLGALEKTWTAFSIYSRITDY